MVLYRGKCIKPSKCPRKYRAQGRVRPNIFDFYHVSRGKNPLITGKLPPLPGISRRKHRKYRKPHRKTRRKKSRNKTNRRLPTG